MKGQLGVLGPLEVAIADELGCDPAIVAIGDMDTWRQSCGRVPSYEQLRFCSLVALNREVLEFYRPELIVSPVVTPQFDCIDVAGALARAGYTGAYRALARDFPNNQMICREVRGYFPTLDFDICEIQTTPSRRIN